MAVALTPRTLHDTFHRQGRYVADKAELRLRMLEMFPIENAFWQMEFLFLDKHNQTMQCDYTEVAVTDE